MAPGGLVTPTGRSISFGEIRIDRFADGRIVEARSVPEQRRGRNA
jgi:predicted ester cyclase